MFITNTFSRYSDSVNKSAKKIFLFHKSCLAALHTAALNLLRASFSKCGTEDVRNCLNQRVFKLQRGK